MTGELYDGRPLRLAPTSLSAGRARRAVAIAVAISVALAGAWQAIAIPDGAIGTLAGLGLLSLSLSLGRGRRRALLIATAVAAGLAALDLGLGLDGPALAMLGLTLLLALSAPCFPTPGDPATRRRLLAGAVVGAGALLADLAHAHGVVAHPLLAAAGIAAVLLLALSAGPWRDRRGRDPETREAARRILDTPRQRHARTLLAPARQADLPVAGRPGLPRLHDGRRRRAGLGRADRPGRTATGR